jgi:hypothetical protein
MIAKMAKCLLKNIKIKTEWQRKKKISPFYLVPFSPASIFSMKSKPKQTIPRKLTGKLHIYLTDE